MTTAGVALSWAVALDSAVPAVCLIFEKTYRSGLLGLPEDLVDLVRTSI
jgi:hypothetical protein